MNLRNLGKSGLKVSAVGLGCNNLGGRLDRDGTQKLIPAAIDLGITLFDTADSYPVGKPGVSEELLGEALGARRKDIAIATKFANVMGPGEMMRGGSRRWIMTAVEGSLRRLKTDWIDLYQMHFPDPNTPVEETLRALDDVIRAGKVRYIGCSNFAGWQIATARAASRELGIDAFVSDQDEYSLLVREVEREIIPAARASGMGFLPYFPLASGFLTGKYRRNQPMPAGARITAAKIFQDNFLTDENWQIVERLGDFCETRGKTLLDLAFSWLLANPTVSSVIAGATKIEQLQANVAAAEWNLSADELATVDRIAPLPKTKKIH
ncbi:MAG TPA: aldo/keto reductase [Stellaceae bacterium]|nr:aldo/keto reductase [Stellaceae bacterium]